MRAMNCFCHPATSSRSARACGLKLAHRYRLVRRRSLPNLPRPPWPPPGCPAASALCITSALRVASCAAIRSRTFPIRPTDSPERQDGSSLERLPSARAALLGIIPVAGSRRHRHAHHARRPDGRRFGALIERRKHWSRDGAARRWQCAACCALGNSILTPAVMPGLSLSACRHGDTVPHVVTFCTTTGCSRSASRCR